MRYRAIGLFTILAAAANPAQANLPRAEVHAIDAGGIGRALGTIDIVPAAAGVKLVANLTRLPPGEHGLQVHEHGECGPGPDAQGTPAAGMAAGAVWQAADTAGAEQPFIFATADGSAIGAAILPGVADAEALRGRSLVVLANRRDGARIACGVIR